MRQRASDGGGKPAPIGASNLREVVMGAQDNLTTMLAATCYCEGTAERTLRPRDHRLCKPPAAWRTLASRW